MSTSAILRTAIVLAACVTAGACGGTRSNAPSDTTPSTPEQLETKARITFHKWFVFYEKDNKALIPEQLALVGPNFQLVSPSLTSEVGNRSDYESYLQGRGPTGEHAHILDSVTINATEGYALAGVVAYRYFNRNNKKKVTAYSLKYEFKARDVGMAYLVLDSVEIKMDRGALPDRAFPSTLASHEKAIRTLMR